MATILLVFVKITQSFSYLITVFALHQGPLKKKQLLYLNRSLVFKIHVFMCHVVKAPDWWLFSKLFTEINAVLGGSGACWEGPRKETNSGLQMVLIDKLPVGSPIKECTTCCTVCVSVAVQATKNADFRQEFRDSCARWKPVGVLLH